MRSVPSSTLHAQVPTASGLTALAYCSRCVSFVGLGLTPARLALLEIKNGTQIYRAVVWVTLDRSILLE